MKTQRLHICFKVVQTHHNPDAMKIVYVIELRWLCAKSCDHTAEIKLMPFDWTARGIAQLKSSVTFFEDIFHFNSNINSKEWNLIFHSNFKAQTTQGAEAEQLKL